MRLTLGLTMWTIACNYLSAVFSTPDYLRFGITSCLTNQFRWATFWHHHIAGCLFIDYIWWDYYFQKCRLDSLIVREGAEKGTMEETSRISAIKTISGLPSRERVIKLMLLYVLAFSLDLYSLDTCIVLCPPFSHS